MRRRAKRTRSLIFVRTPCLRRCAVISTASPNQLGVERLDSEVVWIFTEPSAILTISPSLVRSVAFFLFKEAYFYADVLLVTARCAIRGQDLCTHCPRALKPASRLLVVALRFLKLCQRAPGFPGGEMRLAHLRFPNAQRPLVERLRFTCKCDY